MYNYAWDPSSGGYVLDTKISASPGEVRPVFHEELDLLGFDKYWDYPAVEQPLLWAEGRRYFYRGELVAEASGGGLYTAPTLKRRKEGLALEPTDIAAMVSKSRPVMNALVQETARIIYETHNDYKHKVNITYVAFSGGKDSVVLLDLVQKALPHDAFKVVFSDTTMEVSATYELVEEAKTNWPTVQFHTARSHMDAVESWGLFGPPGRTQRWCCAVHKSAPSLLKLREMVARGQIIAGQRPPDKIRALVFDGVRAEESEARSSYPIVSDGKKHSTQVNCSPMLSWGTGEVFLYILDNHLILNDAYRNGATRVGCAMCPLASSWWDFVANRVYNTDVQKFARIIESNGENKVKNPKELRKYMDSGGWKGRMGGRDLNNGGSKIIEQTSGEDLVINVARPNTDWKEWMKALGNLVYLGGNQYSVQFRGEQYKMDIESMLELVKVRVSNGRHTKDSIRFTYLLKNVFNKAAYCVNCHVCMVECPFGAMVAEGDRIKVTDKCSHCESCLDMPKGCLAAKSLAIYNGSNNMDIKGINRYQHFGFRKAWLNYFFQEQDEFWNCGKLGKYQYDGFRVWLKEAGLTSGNMFNEVSRILSRLGSDDPNVWAVIWINLAYNSALMGWYMRNISFDFKYDTEAIVSLMGNSQSISSRENAVTSLKETFRLSPIGPQLGLGLCEMKGSRVASITRSAWHAIPRLVLLYCLYRFAEECDGHYAFTLSYLCDDTIRRQGISPSLLFGVDANTIKAKLMTSAQDYPDYLSVDFNKDLDNIDLRKSKTSLDVLRLL